MNKLFELSKQAKRCRAYDLEKGYLQRALVLAPTNTKLINALIRNLRREGNILELRNWLERLYELNHNGKILFELIQLEKSVGNLKRVKELLLENQRIVPNSKRIKEKIKKVEEQEKMQIISNALFVLTEEDVELVKMVRDIIYGEEDFATRYSKMVSMMGSQPEEVLVALMSELYKNEALDFSALSFLKKYKEKLNPEIDGKKQKLSNLLLELVSSKKTKRYHWSNFWLSNTIIMQEEKGSSKILMKNKLDRWLL